MTNRHSLRRRDAEFEEKGWLLRMLSVSYDVRRVHVLIYSFHEQLLTLGEFEDKLVKFHEPKA